jgi:hypothetical protein
MRLRSSTMPATDSCIAVRVPCGSLSPESETRCRPPGVSRPLSLHTCRIHSRSPWWIWTSLSLASSSGHACLLSGFRSSGLGVSSAERSQFCYTLCAAFRPHLAMTPLRFASTSPPSGCAGDFHAPAVEHARHTREKLRALAQSFT